MTLISPSLRTRLAALIAAALLYGCASGNSGQNEAPAPASPLSGLAGRQVLVLPAQLLSTATSPGSFDVRPEHAQLLPILDQEITDAFRKQGVKDNWTFPRELIAAATRNAGLAGNPLGLSVAGIRRWKAGDTPLPEPLASDIRSLVSLTNARYVIMPIETRIDLTGGQRRGILHVFLIDSRTARIAWVGDAEGQSLRDPQVISETLSPYGFRLLARDLAGVFAEMVVAQ